MSSTLAIARVQGVSLLLASRLGCVLILHVSTAKTRTRTIIIKVVVVLVTKVITIIAMLYVNRRMDQVKHRVVYARRKSRYAFRLLPTFLCITAYKDARMDRQAKLLSAAKRSQSSSSEPPLASSDVGVLVGAPTPTPPFLDSDLSSAGPETGPSPADAPHVVRNSMPLLPPAHGDTEVCVSGGDPHVRYPQASRGMDIDARAVHSIPATALPCLAHARPLTNEIELEEGRASFALAL